MHLFKPRNVVKVKDASGAWVIKHGLDGRPVYDGRSSVWWMSYREGGRRVRRSLGLTDKAAAEEAARAIVRRSERVRVGLINDTDEQFARPLVEHVYEWEVSLSGRGVTDGHRRDRRKALDDFVAATAAKTLRDFNESVVDEWIEALSKEKTRLGGTRSARDLNRRIRALRQFSRWCIATRRVPFDPLPTLRPRQESADRRHERRALTPDEARLLLDAAARRPLDRDLRRRVRKPLSAARRRALVGLGRERALLYATALHTGMRRGEMVQLRVGDLDARTGFVHVRASTTKAKKPRDIGPVPWIVAALLSLHRTSRSDVRVFQRETFPSARGFELDLRAAGIEKVDARGLHAVFHGLRKTSVTWSQVYGKATAREAQAVAGHASPALTLATYTDLALLDVGGVYARLPSLGLERFVGEAPAGGGDAATPSLAMAHSMARGSQNGAGDGRTRPVEALASVSADSREGGRAREDLYDSAPQASPRACIAQRLERRLHKQQDGAPSDTSANGRIEAADAALRATLSAGVASDAGRSMAHSMTPDSPGVAGVGRTAPVAGHGADDAPDAITLARWLLALAATHPDPLPLVEAARTLIAGVTPAPPIAPTPPAPDDRPVFAGPMTSALVGSAASRVATLHTLASVEASHRTALGSGAPRGSSCPTSNTEDHHA